jgi:hypothetical protein
MKKNIQNSIANLLTIFIMTLFVTGCSKYNPDCGCNCDHNNLSFGIPYKQGDIIKFTDSLGNKLTFTLKKSVTGQYTKYQNGGSPDCGSQRTVYSEYNNNFFEETNNTKRLFIGNYAFGDTIYDLSENLYVGIDSFNFSYWTEWLKINLKVIPEITLNGKKYTNIFVPDAAIWPGKQIYYNKQIGIVSFKTDSVQWYLDN